MHWVGLLWPWIFFFFFESCGSHEKYSTALQWRWGFVSWTHAEGKLLGENVQRDQQKKNTDIDGYAAWGKVLGSSENNNLCEK